MIPWTIRTHAQLAYLDAITFISLIIVRPRAYCLGEFIVHQFDQILDIIALILSYRQELF